MDRRFQNCETRQTTKPSRKMMKDPSGRMLPTEPAILQQDYYAEDGVESARKTIDFAFRGMPAKSRRIVPITVALCFCMLTHSYLLISVFPYSGFLAIHLLNLRLQSEDSAGPYAGLIASSFMAGRHSPGAELPIDTVAHLSCTYP